MNRNHVLVIAGLLMFWQASLCATPSSSFNDARLSPGTGTYFGVYLDTNNDSPAAFNKRLGLNASVFVSFYTIPFSDVDNKRLGAFIDQVKEQNGAALLTLEPHHGLDVITPAYAELLAKRFALYNKMGVPIFLRFAHEMNGYWYPWCQKPVEYVYAFRTLAKAVHQYADKTAMMWAPNIGGSYPPEKGGYLPEPGSYNFKLIDTNADGQINLKDDMYAPFYPGDDVVDWVGMSVYHWGQTYPWGENELPEVNSFINRITGNYVGMNGDERDVPDFYQTYVVKHNKPMAITETAALYNTSMKGESEIAIKRAWWRQVFSQEVRTEYPGIKMINWFETRKYESEVKSNVDWSVTFNLEIVSEFLKDIPTGYLLFSNDLDVKDLNKRPKK